MADETMTDELAKLYVQYKGVRYRLKVFDGMVGIECQPGGENRLISKTGKEPENVWARHLYNHESREWDYESLGRLLKAYSYRARRIYPMEQRAYPLADESKYELPDNRKEL